MHALHSSSPHSACTRSTALPCTQACIPPAAGEVCRPGRAPCAASTCGQPRTLKCCDECARSAHLLHAAGRAHCVQEQCCSAHRAVRMRAHKEAQAGEGAVLHACAEVIAHAGVSVRAVRTTCNTSAPPATKHVVRALHTVHMQAGAHKDGRQEKAAVTAVTQQAARSPAPSLQHSAPPTPHAALSCVAMRHAQR